MIGSNDLVARPSLSPEDRRHIDAADGFHFFKLYEDALAELALASHQHPAEFIVRGRILAAQKKWNLLIEASFEATTKFSSENELVAQQVLALNASNQARLGAEIVAQSEPWMRKEGVLFYNLACYESTHGSPARAKDYLSIAFQANKHLRSYACKDPEVKDFYKDC